VTFLDWIFLENGDESKNYETWVLCRTDQIRFLASSFSKFGLD